jgi:HHH domain
LEFDPLDSTRIHPESYEHAVRIAQSATGDLEADVAVENALARPKEVLALEIDAYDRHLRDQGLAGPAGTLLSTLIDIQMEFAGPYSDMRPTLRQLTVGYVWVAYSRCITNLKHVAIMFAIQDDELFWLTAGQSNATVKPGRQVEAVVRHVTADVAICTLPELNGLEAV